MNYKIDIDARTYNEIRAELLKYLRTTLPEWTNVSASDPALALLNGVAASGENLYFYIDRIFNESNLSTAQWRESVAKLVGRAGYILSPVKSAKTPVTISVPTPAVSPIIIPQGSVFSTEDGTVFTTTESASINATESSTIVNVFNGEVTLNESLGIATPGRYIRFKLKEKTALGFISGCREFNWRILCYKIQLFD